MALLDLVKDLNAAGVTAQQIEAVVGGGPESLGTTGDPSARGVQHVVRVKVVSNATGGGKYLGPIITSQEMGDINETSTLAESDLGTVITDTTLYALILNAAEVGQSTHDLTAGTPMSKVFIGYLLPRRSTTDRLVVVINGTDWEACT